MVIEPILSFLKAGLHFSFRKIQYAHSVERWHLSLGDVVQCHDMDGLQLTGGPLGTDSQGLYCAQSLFMPSASSSKGLLQRGISQETCPSRL